MRLFPLLASSRSGSCASEHVFSRPLDVGMRFYLSDSLLGSRVFSRGIHIYTPLFNSPCSTSSSPHLPSSPSPHSTWLLPPLATSTLTFRAVRSLRRVSSPARKVLIYIRLYLKFLILRRVRLRYRYSPLLLVLSVHMAFARKKVRYHLGHHISLPDVHPSLVPPFDARYPIHDLNVQIPEPHLIGTTLQVPSPTSIHHVHQHPQPDFGLQQHSLLDIAPHHSSRHDLASLSPPDSFSFNLPQSRLPEPHMNLSHEPHPPASSRRTHSIAPIDTKQRALPATSTKGSAPSSSNPAPTRPPRREASTAVIACRQWYVLS